KPDVGRIEDGGACRVELGDEHVVAEPVGGPVTGAGDTASAKLLGRIHERKIRGVGRAGDIQVAGAVRGCIVGKVAAVAAQVGAVLQDRVDDERQAGIITAQLETE